MTSFMSEHTVELYLVPRFRALLNMRYTGVLPFFYWKRREGSILSHRDGFPALITACAMFPRRPKVMGEQIEMTVNEEVYLMSKHLREAGIPTFLGFPYVNALSEFATDFECLWFSPNSKDFRYTSHEISSGKGTAEYSTLFGPFKDEKEIHGYIEANAIRQTWCDLLDVLFEVHSKISQEDIIKHRFLFGPPYKPVYFLMWGNLEKMPTQ
jgi:hypothetical protein